MPSSKSCGVLNFSRKMSKDAFDGLGAIKINDNVGILYLGDKHYLAFDDMLKYIEINDENLKRYGIEMINESFWFTIVQI